MKTIIAGTRTAQPVHTMTAVAESGWLGEITEVISGRAQGPDSHGETIAVGLNLPVRLFPADWVKHGKAAGPIRNRQMADYADALIAVWDGQSRGTKNMIEEAEKRNLKVFVYRID